MYVRKGRCYHYLEILFLIKTIIYVFLCVVITTLKGLKFSINATLYLLMSLPCMTSSSFTLRLFIGLFRHKYQNFSRTNVWIWILCLKCLLSFILLIFWFRRSDSISEIWYILQIHFTINKLLYTDPQLLRQCTFWNCHHGRQLTATHSIVCYYIVCFLAPKTKISPSLTLFSYPSLSSSCPAGNFWIGMLGEFGDWPQNPGYGRGVV